MSSWRWDDATTRLFEQQLNEVDREFRGLFAVVSVNAHQHTLVHIWGLEQLQKFGTNHGGIKLDIINHACCVLSMNEECNLLQKSHFYIIPQQMVWSASHRWTGFIASALGELTGSEWEINYKVYSNWKTNESQIRENLRVIGKGEGGKPLAPRSPSTTHCLQSSLVVGRPSDELKECFPKVLSESLSIWTVYAKIDFPNTTHGNNDCSFYNHQLTLLLLLLLKPRHQLWLCFLLTSSQPAAPTNTTNSATLPENIFTMLTHLNRNSARRGSSERHPMPPLLLSS